MNEELIAAAVARRAREAFRWFTRCSRCGQPIFPVVVPAGSEE